MAKDRYPFHKRICRLVLPLIRTFWLNRRFRMTYPEVPELPEGFLLICNHVTNIDPFLVVASLRRHVYFVATEHLFRLGLRSKLIRFLQDPIPLAKGGSTSSAVLEILRRLKAGRSVCLFAEGNCTWDGRAIGIPGATGKVVKKSKAPLVTVRIIGGYFAHPRWAYTDRKGPLRVEVVKIYQPEELAAMKPDEINRHIEEDIGEDAYERQLADPQRYPGKDLAKDLGRALLACPKCRRIRSITGSGNRFSCSCGLQGSFDEYGMISGEGFDFRTVRGWEDWQREFFAALPDPGEQETVYASDDGMILYHVAGHSTEKAAEGTLSGSSRGLRFGALDFPFADMAALAIRLHGTVTFSMKDGTYYELKKADKSDYSGRIYQFLFNRYAHETENGAAAPIQAER